MIIRELLTSIGFDFDASGADEAIKKSEKLQNALETVGTVMSLGAVFAGLHGFVSMASDAEQTLAKLKLSFVENTDDVLAWADATAKATGASKYELREFAGTMGSMLVPTLKGNRKLAAEMSTNLSALAIDLAAINNEDPGETLSRLFSGMTGETEGVERLGIGIKAAALEEFALTRGIKKKITAMTIAEKTELIYQKILKDTEDKVGAAASESVSFAGKQRIMGTAIKEAGTNLGMKLLPYASEFVSVLTRGVHLLGEWAADTNKVVAAFTVLGTIMGAMAIRLVLLNLPLIGFAIGCALVAIAVEDLYSSFSKGQGAVATFMEYVIGDKAWERLQKVPKLLGDIAFEMGLTDKQKKERGVNTTPGGKALDVMGGVFGFDPEKLRKAERESYVRSGNKTREELAKRKQTMINPETESTNWAVGFAQRLAGFDPKAIRKGELASYNKTQGQQPAAGPINVNIMGNADKQTVKAIGEAVQRAQEQQLRSLYYTTPVIDTDAANAEHFNRTSRGAWSTVRDDTDLSEAPVYSVGGGGD